jgi:hypothetical protein
LESFGLLECFLKKNSDPSFVSHLSDNIMKYLDLKKTHKALSIYSTLFTPSSGNKPNGRQLLNR